MQAEDENARRRMLPWIFQMLCCAMVFTGAFLPVVHAQTYWLNSAYDEAGEHYPTAEEACLVGELQRRLDHDNAADGLNIQYAMMQ